MNCDQLFFFLRHYKTAAHDEELICGGSSDRPLTPASERQALADAPGIRALTGKVSTIYTSQLQRAFRTGELLNTSLQTTLKVIPSLQEWKMGDWEGQSWHDLPHPFWYEGTPSNGEPRDVFRARTLGAFQQLLATDDRFLVVAHGIVFHELSRSFCGTPIYLETGGLAVFRRYGKAWSVEELPISSQVSSL